MSAKRAASVEEWDLDALRHAVNRGGPATPDDVSITMDGRRLDSRDAVLTFLAKVESERPDRGAHDRRVASMTFVSIRPASSTCWSAIASTTSSSAGSPLRPTAQPGRPTILIAYRGRPRANLQRLADAMRDLGARLRVGGMSDDEASQLPVVLDADMLARLRVSTWVG